MHGRKKCALSQAGKEVLNKNVVHASPTYNMSCFLLFATVIRSLNFLVLQFVLGGSEGNKKNCAGSLRKIFVNLKI